MTAPEWNLGEGFARYLLAIGKSPQTQRTYVSAAGLFCRWCQGRGLCPSDATRTDLHFWLQERRQSVSASRSHVDLAALKCFYRWHLDLEEDEEPPITRGAKVKRGRRLPTKPLSLEELRLLVQACDNERNRLIVILLAYTGLRISEFASLTSENIDWPSGTLEIVGKGDKERPLKPPAEVMGRLRSFLGFFHEGPLWLSLKANRPLSAHQIRKIIYDIARDAGIEDVHPHRFRAFFATYWMDHFGDIQALQSMMGHESVETTSRYSEFTKYRRGLEQMSQLPVLKLA